MSQETTETQAEERRKKLRNLLFLLVSIPLVMGSLLCCGQVAMILGSTSRSVDTRSKLEADYGVWPFEKVGAINLAAFKEDYQKDQVVNGESIAAVPGDNVESGVFWPTSMPTPMPVAGVETQSATETALAAAGTATYTVMPGAGASATFTPTNSGSQPESTATRAPTTSRTPSPTARVTTTRIPTRTLTGTPTRTPTRTATRIIWPTYTYTPESDPDTATPTWTSVAPVTTWTPTPSPTSTSTTPVLTTSTFTPTPTPTHTMTVTLTPQPTFTFTFTPVTPSTPTHTATFTLTPTNTPIGPTLTFTPTPTFTLTPTATHTFTPTPTFTNTPVLEFPVHPIAENNGKSDPDLKNPGGCMGAFGYMNDSPQMVPIPLGDRNSLSEATYEVSNINPGDPNPNNLPSLFYTGRWTGNVVVKWNTGADITWNVDGRSAKLIWCNPPTPTPVP